MENKDATTILLKNIYRRWLIASALIAIASLATNAQSKKFEVITRKPLPAGNAALLGITKSRTAATFSINKEVSPKGTTAKYKVQSGGTAFEMDALSSIEYARNADRIIVYGDVANKDVQVNAFAKIYSANGSLIKDLGRIASFPYVTTYTDNGNFVVAGNKSEPTAQAQLVLMNFDANGNMLWEKPLSNDVVPVNVFSDANSNRIAVVLYNSSTFNQSIQYYNANGEMIYTDARHNGISAIEFLPSDKVVIAAANEWYLYNMNGSGSLIASGKLQGNALGRYPVTAHPSKDIFFIVSVKNNPSNNGFRLQAFNSHTGAEIVETSFAGQPFWQPVRLANVEEDDTISLITSNEIIGLRLAQ